jgi:hypothetical protein
VGRKPDKMEKQQMGRKNLKSAVYLFIGLCELHLVKCQNFLWHFFLRSKIPCDKMEKG